MENLRSARGGTLASKNQTFNKRQFIQYEPALVAELNEVKPKNQSVSARLLTLLYKRLSFWSRYAKHIHNGRRYFWKSIDELSEELQYSQKQISRGLKALVELGLIIREKLNKHNWKHTYYYYLPHSVGALEEATSTSRSSSNGYRNSRSTYRGQKTGEGPARPEHQQFVPVDVEGIGAPAEPAEGDSTNPIRSVAPAVPVSVRGTPAGAGLSGSSSCRTTTLIPSAPERTKCPHLSIEDNSLLNIQLRQIVEKCLDYGRKGIKPLTGRGIGFAA